MLKSNVQDETLLPSLKEDSNEKRKISKWNNEIKIFFFGSIAAASAKTIVAPLDRAKIIIQISPKKFTFHRLYHIMKSTVDEMGMLGLWKGNSACLARVVPYGGIQFLTHEQMKSLCLYWSYPSNNLSSKQRLLCGCVTGLVSTALTYPLDLIRTRMAVTQHNAFKSVILTFKNTLQSEGIIGLYRGLWISLIGILPYAGTSFFTFESLKSFISENKKNKHTLNQYNLTIFEKLICGGFSGLVAQSFSYPFDIIRRTIQSDCLIQKKKYTFLNSYNVARHVFNSSGLVGGFYKGLSLNWIKGPVATATSFTIFETLKQYFCS